MWHREVVVVVWAVPYSQVVDKSQEGYTLGVSDSSPRTYHTAQCFSSRKINPHNFWLQKPVGVGVMEKLPDFQETLLKGSVGLKTYTDPPLWDLAPGKQLEGHQLHRVSPSQTSRSQAVALSPL